MTRPRAVVILAVAVLGFTAALTGIWDTDFFHHLATGRAIAHGVSFSEDPFLFPFEGSPSSLPPYWLGSLFIYLSSLPSTLIGPQLLVALLTASVCVLLLLDALEDRRSWRDAAIAAALVLLTLPELRVRSAPRPEAFGVLLIAYTMLALSRFERGRPRLLYAFPLVALIWSQLHLSVAIGLGLVGLQVAWTVARAAVAARGGAGAAVGPLREAGVPLAILVAGTLSSAINPSTSPLKVALGFLRNFLGTGGLSQSGGAGGAARVVWGAIEELNPTSLADWGRPFGILVLLAAASFAIHRSKHWGRELAAVAAVGFFSTTSFRFATIAAVVAAPIAARNVLGGLAALEALRPRLARGMALFVGGLALLRAVTAPTLAGKPPSLALDTPTFPVRAGDYLRQIGFDGRLYNEFGAGGYLEWTLDRKVFQDGRGMMKPEDVPDLFPEPIDRTRLSRLDSRWHFDALVLGTRLPSEETAGLVGRLANIWATAADPAVWALVAMDDAAAVYLRRDGRWASRIPRDEFRLVKPGLILPDAAYSDPTTMRGVTQELMRLSADAPACTQCRIGLAGMLLQGMRLPEATPHLEILDRERDPRTRATIDLLLATRAQIVGDLPEAERRFRDAIRHSPDPSVIRRALAMQLLGANRVEEANALLQENLDVRRDSADLGFAANLARRAGDSATAASLEAEAATAQRREIARQRSQEGQRLMDSGRIGEARTAFVEASGLDPSLPEPLIALGYLELLANHPDVAAGSFGRALRIAPEDPDALHGLGMAREALGEPERAASAYRDAIRARPRGRLADDARERLQRLEAR